MLGLGKMVEDGCHFHLFRKIWFGMFFNNGLQADG